MTGLTHGSQQSRSTVSEPPNSNRIPGDYLDAHLPVTRVRLIDCLESPALQAAARAHRISDDDSDHKPHPVRDVGTSHAWGVTAKRVPPTPRISKVGTSSIEGENVMRTPMVFASAHMLERYTGRIRPTRGCTRSAQHRPMSTENQGPDSDFLVLASGLISLYPEASSPRPV